MDAMRRFLNGEGSGVVATLLIEDRGEDGLVLALEAEELETMRRRELIKDGLFIVSHAAFAALVLLYVCCWVGG